jgi:hypothetical protein
VLLLQISTKDLDVLSKALSRLNFCYDLIKPFLLVLVLRNHALTGSRYPMKSFFCIFRAVSLAGSKFKCHLKRNDETGIGQLRITQFFA